MTTSPATPLIYSIKFLVSNFLVAGFLAPKSSHFRENQHVLGTDYGPRFVKPYY